MMELAFSNRFFDDTEGFELEAKQDEILNAIDLLSSVPEMGSRRVPASIEQEFGPCVRKLVVKPFLVIFEIIADEGLLYMHGLVHQRQAK